MQNVKLNLIPGSVMPVVNVSQYDKARQFSLTVYEGSATYSLTGKDVQIRGTKPDGNGFAYDSTDGVVSVSGSTVTISTTQQMTAVGGQTMAELRITQSGVILGTLNFVLMVEPSALSDDTPISDTDIPAIERDFEAALAEAEADALKAEGYAVGTQEGVPAQSGEPYYQDNAKYYKEQADTDATNAGNSATSAAADALKSEGYAVGKQNGEAVTSGSPYYQNNAQYFDTHASEQAYNASQSANSASGSATAASTDALKSEGWAVGKQNGTPVTSGSPYYENNAEYYKNQAAQYAAGGLIFKGSVAFASIPTTGMVNGDMYNITDDFTTDSRFIEGAGVSVKAGADIAWVDSVSKWDILALGGGSDDYSQLINKPQINRHTLTGDQTAAALGLASDAAMTGASAGSAGAKGLVPAPAAGDQDKVLCGDGTWKTPSSSSDMTGATASTPGTHGLVPAPAAGDNTKFLRGDGTWAEAGGGGGGFVLADWLTAGGLNPMSYADLAAVLADEEAVRKLMTIHTAVDYLAGQTAVDASINTILTDNTCAKWINLRDYALDTLYDNALFATIMDASGKYFLGEWAKLSTSPETWGPKGNVPIMTSNTAPYGVASAYQVFDGSDATTASGTDFSYKFVNPVCVKDFVVKDGSGNAITGGALQASNDGSTWVTPVADTFYMAWNVHFGSSTTVGTVQFYGREMRVSVPVMTSNTAPYGEASASSVYGTSFAAWKAFDGKYSSGTDDRWLAAGNITGARITYKFANKICIKQASIVEYCADQTQTHHDTDIFFECSNDGTNWTSVGSLGLTDTKKKDVQSVEFDNDNEYLYVSVRFDTYNILSGNVQYCGIAELQFYGFDYSEYDWDTDNPRRYLYDHGVELETLERTTLANGWVAWSGATDTSDSVLLPDSIHIISNTAKIDGYGTSNPINLSTYDLFRFKCDANGSTNNNQTAVDFLVSSSKTNFATSPAMISQNWFWGSPEGYIDVSSVSQNAYLTTMTANRSTRTGYVYEMWLE